MNQQEQIRKDFEELKAEADAGLFEANANGSKGFLCEIIRTAVSLNPDASVQDIIAALPELNPATIKIQYRNSRRLDAECDALLDSKG